MADETRHVPTEFEVAGYEKTVGQLGALGSAFEGLGGLISKATSFVNPLNIAIGALATTLGGGAIMKAGSEFEDLQIGLAQTLRFMGEGGKTFEDAMHNSSVMMKRIVADAGPLPGNAMDYANALQVAGTTVNRATGDFAKSYELIKKTTAVGISMGGNAQLAAAELNHMLDASHGMMHTFGDFNQKMLVSMRQLPGLAGLTAVQFNKFTLDKRLDIVQRAMGQFDDQVKAASSTWTAIKGATEATTSLLVKSATMPLFEAMKKNLQSANNAILQADGNFAPLGQRIVAAGVWVSEKLVGGFNAATHAIALMGEQLARAADSPLFKRLADLAPMMAGLAVGVIGARAGPAAGAIAGVAAGRADQAGAFENMPGGEAAAFAGQIAQIAAVMSPLGLALSGLADALTRAETATRLAESAFELFDTLTTPIQTMSEVAGQAASMMGDLFAGVLPGLMDGLLSILTPLMTLFDAVYGVAGVILAQLRPALAELWEAVGGLFSSIGDFLNPVIGVLGAILVGTASILGDVFGGAIQIAAGALSGLAHGLASFLSWLGKLMGKAFADLGLSLPTKPAQEGSNALADFITKLKGFGKGAPGSQAMIGGKGGGSGAMKPPEARGGGGRVVQDFRFSRFEINQRFQEGYDPDRIAVAFASDVAKLGEKKLQSGLEPHFGVR